MILGSKHATSLVPQVTSKNDKNDLPTTKTEKTWGGNKNLKKERKKEEKRREKEGEKRDEKREKKEEKFKK